MFLTLVNSTEEGHICRPSLKSQGVFSFFLYILEELAAPEKCVGDPSPCVGPAARDAMLEFEEPIPAER